MEPLDVRCCVVVVVDLVEALPRVLDEVVRLVAFGVDDAAGCVVAAGRLVVVRLGVVLVVVVVVVEVGRVVEGRVVEVFVGVVVVPVEVDVPDVRVGVLPVRVLTVPVDGVVAGCDEGLPPGRTPLFGVGVVVVVPLLRTEIGRAHV